jgi:hypothetical protein
MPDDRAGVSPPVLLPVRKEPWVSPHATAEYTATLSRRRHHPYCSQLEKAVGVCLAATKSRWRTISHAFVLYRELVSELSHADLGNKFADRIALICPSLPPTDN